MRRIDRQQSEHQRSDVRPVPQTTRRGADERRGDSAVGSRSDRDERVQVGATRPSVPGRLDSARRETTQRSAGTYGGRVAGGDSAVRTDGGARSWQRYDQRYAGRTTQQFEGQVERFEHADGGYRVWLGGSSHCFWVPEDRWQVWPLHIGISVVFGGFWNPLGYYNVYDYGSYGGGYYGGGYYGGGYYGGGYYGGGYYGRGYYGRSYYGSYGGYGPGYYSGYGSYSSPRPYGAEATSYVQGYVDRFDDVNGSIVIRDDQSGRYVTVYVAGDDSRFRTLRVGDWVVLAGTWTRDGYFDAERVDELR